LDIKELSERLKIIDLARECETLPPGFGTMLFYGPPGTGKTAVARYLAEQLGKDLITKRASDILDCLVGGTEQKIAQAFREAEEEDAVLVLDEADSFIYSRDMAKHSWETSFVNEFLVAIEECQCFLICTSNRRANMDPAAMRRFSFKVPFRHAGPSEVKALYLSLLSPLTGYSPDEDFLFRLSRERNLAPGDFHAVRSKNRLGLKKSVSHEELLKELVQERDLKLEEDISHIGF
jgi:SpoVK/Ycf46/Vps4 family AAA+-type ATPase